MTFHMESFNLLLSFVLKHATCLTSSEARFLVKTTHAHTALENRRMGL